MLEIIVKPTPALSNTHSALERVSSTIKTPGAHTVMHFDTSNASTVFSKDPPCGGRPSYGGGIEAERLTSELHHDARCTLQDQDSTRACLWWQQRYGAGCTIGVSTGRVLPTVCNR